MSDSSATQLKSETEIKRRQESSFLEALVPIPDFFFNIKAEIEPIGGSAWVIRMLAYLLYFLTLCVMFGSFTYYSLPAQRLSLESLVTSEWQKTGFACKPLQKTTLHGLSTDWSFDECIANVNAPDTSNVKAATKHANVIHYDYNFATDGDSKVSFYDVAYASSVLQKTNQATEDWKRDGYSCYPESPYDNTFKVRYNHSECFDVIKVPSVDSVLEATCHWDGVTYTCFKYYPFGSGTPAYGSHFISGSCLDIGVAIGAAYSGSSDSNGNVWRYPCGGDISIGGASYYNGVYESIEQSSAIKSWTQVLLLPDTYSERRFDNNGICAPLKLNGNGFRCFDKPKPPATKEPAIQRYASEYPPATICAPLKLNAPFQCTRNVEVPATTRLSLSVAAAQAVFAVAGIILVALLRKLRTPPKSTESLSGDDDIRSVVRKLRITVDKLDSKVDQLGTEFRTGQHKLSSGHGEHDELIQKLLSK